MKKLTGKKLVRGGRDGSQDGAKKAWNSHKSGGTV